MFEGQNSTLLVHQVWVDSSQFMFTNSLFLVTETFCNSTVTHYGLYAFDSSQVTIYSSQPLLGFSLTILSSQVILCTSNSELLDIVIADSSLFLGDSSSSDNRVINMTCFNGTITLGPNVTIHNFSFHAGTLSSLDSEEPPSIHHLDLENCYPSLFSVAFLHSVSVVDTIKYRYSSNVVVSGFDRLIILPSCLVSIITYKDYCIDPILLSVLSGNLYLTVPNKIESHIAQFLLQEKYSVVQLVCVDVSANVLRLGPLKVEVLELSVTKGTLFVVDDFSCVICNLFCNDCGSSAMYFFDAFINVQELTVHGFEVEFHNATATIESFSLSESSLIAEGSTMFVQFCTGFDSQVVLSSSTFVLGCDELSDHFPLMGVYSSDASECTISSSCFSTHFSTSVASGSSVVVDGILAYIDEVVILDQSFLQLNFNNSSHEVGSMLLMGGTLEISSQLSINSLSFFFGSIGSSLENVSIYLHHFVHENIGIKDKSPLFQITNVVLNILDSCEVVSHFSLPYAFSSIKTLPLSQTVIKSQKSSTFDLSAFGGLAGLVDLVFVGKCHVTFPEINFGSTDERNNSFVVFFNQTESSIWLKQIDVSGIEMSVLFGNLIFSHNIFAEYFVLNSVLKHYQPVIFLHCDVSVSFLVFVGIEVEISYSTFNTNMLKFLDSFVTFCYSHSSSSQLLSNNSQLHFLSSNFTLSMVGDHHETSTDVVDLGLYIHDSSTISMFFETSVASKGFTVTDSYFQSFSTELSLEELIMLESSHVSISLETVNSTYIDSILLRCSDFQIGFDLIVQSIDISGGVLYSDYLHATSQVTALEVTFVQTTSCPSVPIQISLPFFIVDVLFYKCPGLSSALDIENVSLLAESLVIVSTQEDVIFDAFFGFVLGRLQISMVLPEATVTFDEISSKVHSVEIIRGRLFLNGVEAEKGEYLCGQTKEATVYLTNTFHYKDFTVLSCNVYIENAFFLVDGNIFHVDHSIFYSSNSSVRLQTLRSVVNSSQLIFSNTTVQVTSHLQLDHSRTNLECSVLELNGILIDGTGQHLIGGVLSSVVVYGHVEIGHFFTLITFAVDVSIPCNSFLTCFSNVSMTESCTLSVPCSHSFVLCDACDLLFSGVWSGQLLSWSKGNLLLYSSLGLLPRNARFFGGSVLLLPGSSLFFESLRLESMYLSLDSTATLMINSLQVMNGAHLAVTDPQTQPQILEVFCSNSSISFQSFLDHSFFHYNPHLMNCVLDFATNFIIFVPSLDDSYNSEFLGPDPVIEMSKLMISPVTPHCCPTELCVLNFVGHHIGLIFGLLKFDFFCSSYLSFNVFNDEIELFASNVYTTQGMTFATFSMSFDILDVKMDFKVSICEPIIDFIEAPPTRGGTVHVYGESFGHGLVSVSYGDSDVVVVSSNHSFVLLNVSSGQGCNYFNLSRAFDNATTSYLLCYQKPYIFTSSPQNLNLVGQLTLHGINFGTSQLYVVINYLNVSFTVKQHTHEIINIYLDPLCKFHHHLVYFSIEVAGQVSNVLLLELQVPQVKVIPQSLPSSGGVVYLSHVFDSFLLTPECFNVSFTFSSQVDVIHSFDYHFLLHVFFIGPSQQNSLFITYELFSGFHGLFELPISDFLMYVDDYVCFVSLPCVLMVTSNSTTDFSFYTTNVANDVMIVAAEIYPSYMSITVISPTPQLLSLSLCNKMSFICAPCQNSPPFIEISAVFPSQIQFFAPFQREILSLSATIANYYDISSWQKSLSFEADFELVVVNDKSVEVILSITQQTNLKISLAHVQGVTSTKLVVEIANFVDLCPQLSRNSVYVLYLRSSVSDLLFISSGSQVLLSEGPNIVILSDISPFAVLTNRKDVSLSTTVPIETVDFLLPSNIIIQTGKTSQFQLLGNQSVLDFYLLCEPSCTAETDETSHIAFVTSYQHGPFQMSLIHSCGLSSWTKVFHGFSSTLPAFHLVSNSILSTTSSSPVTVLFHQELQCLPFHIISVHCSVDWDIVVQQSTSSLCEIKIVINLFDCASELVLESLYWLAEGFDELKVTDILVFSLHHVHVFNSLSVYSPTDVRFDLFSGVTNASEIITSNSFFIILDNAKYPCYLTNLQ
ncbi:hypothetical protein RCL1_006190 [Eukaryota sp. TZLM3-RCL]